MAAHTQGLRSRRSPFVALLAASAVGLLVPEAGLVHAAPRAGNGVAHPSRVTQPIGTWCPSSKGSQLELWVPARFRRRVGEGSSGGADLVKANDRQQSGAVDTRTGTSRTGPWPPSRRCRYRWPP